MSLLNTKQHKQLMLLRGNLAHAVLDNDPDNTQRSLGIVQGYLLGLHAAQEIDFADVQAFEFEVQADLAFLYAVRDASHAH